MNKIKIIPAMLVFISSGLFAQTSIDRPVAIVKLTRMDVISEKKLAYNVSLYEQQTGRTLEKEEKVQVLETLINQMLVFSGCGAG